MEEVLLEKIENAKREYFRVLEKPERYRKEHELACAETRLITLECLAIEAGLIKSGTI